MSVRTIKVEDIELGVMEGSALARVLDEGNADANNDGVFSKYDISDCPSLECEARYGTREQIFMHTLSLAFAKSGVIAYEQRGAFKRLFLMYKEVQEYNAFVKDICAQGTASSFWNEFELSCDEWNISVAPRIAGGLGVFSEVRGREHEGIGAGFKGELYWVMSSLAGNVIDHIPSIGSDECADNVYGLAYDEAVVPEIIRPLYIQMAQSYFEAGNLLHDAIGEMREPFKVHVNGVCGGANKKELLVTGPMVIERASSTHALKKECVSE